MSLGDFREIARQIGGLRGDEVGVIGLRGKVVCPVAIAIDGGGAIADTVDENFNGAVGFSGAGDSRGVVIRIHSTGDGRRRGGGVDDEEFKAYRYIGDIARRIGRSGGDGVATLAHCLTDRDLVVATGRSAAGDRFTVGEDRHERARFGKAFKRRRGVAGQVIHTRVAAVAVGRQIRRRRSVGRGGVHSNGQVGRCDTGVARIIGGGGADVVAAVGQVAVDGVAPVAIPISVGGAVGDIIDEDFDGAQRLSGAGDRRSDDAGEQQIEAGLACLAQSEVSGGIRRGGIDFKGLAGIFLEGIARGVFDA